MPEPEERFTVGCPKCGKRYVLTSAAIGKKGVNIKLASKLTGWDIQIANRKGDGGEPQTKQ